MPQPIFDNHFHLDFTGRCVDAVKDFEKSGGTHMMLVNKPYHTIPINSPGDFEKEFQNTLALAEKARKESGVKVFSAVGPHPVYITHFTKKGLPIAQAEEDVKKGIDIAKRLVIEKKASAIGEVGRPHYPVEPDIWTASNRILLYALEAARDAGCAIILHTESASEKSYKEIAEMADKAGIKKEKVVKHFSPPLVLESENFGLFPSILASKDAIDVAIKKGNRFMMETDYIDDARRPGAVLGPATVPKKTKDLLRREVFKEEDIFKIHKENPEKVYGIEVNV